MRMNKKSNFQLYLAFTCVIILALIVRTFIFNIRIIEGDSMSPNLKAGDLVVVSMLSKNFNPGDIVIFTPPQTKKLILIKRIIAGPDSRVFINDYKIIVNDILLNTQVINKNEDYMQSLEGEKPGQTYFTQWKLNSLYCRYSDTLTSKSNEYILFGDNRCNSTDSRVFGAINSQSIIGKVIYLIKLSKLLP
jgi:signal peptidase I